jgi:ubiquinone/menaquinone biosynthesis C-methylase UbiE
LYNNEERIRWQKPKRILIELGLKSGSTFIDVGCGTGFFSIPAAKIVNFKGTVYAIDSNSYAIEELKNIVAKERLANIQIIEGRAEELIICERCADMIFFGIVLHDFIDPKKVLRNARKMIKSSGRLINLDWKKRLMNIGPPFHKRFDEEQSKILIENAGFKVSNIEDSGNYHYIIYAIPV